MKSLGAMILQLEPLVGTKDLSEWETDFVRDMHSLTLKGTATRILSERQVEVVERLYKRHFGDAEI